MIFPLGCAALTVVLNGSLVHSYRGACLSGGRIVAPLQPYVTALAASIEYDGATVLIRRGDRFTQVEVRDGYVELAPVLRTFGAKFNYHARDRRLEIAIARAGPIATPTPFNPAVPSSPPKVLFTSVPQTTPKPLLNAQPQPRRTPLPVNAASPRPSD